MSLSEYQALGLVELLDVELARNLGRKIGRAHV